MSVCIFFSRPPTLGNLKMTLMHYGSEDKFLLVNFACDAGAKDDFEAQFRTWAGKVTIK